MSEWEKNYEKEYSSIKEEREFYPGNTEGNKFAYKLFDVLSFLFQASGFIALILIFFTDITLVQATCLFVIGYVISPSDGDRYELQVKGMVEDLGHIRLNTTIIGKYITNNKKA